MKSTDTSKLQSHSEGHENEKLSESNENVCVMPEVEESETGIENVILGDSSSINLIGLTLDVESNSKPGQRDFELLRTLGAGGYGKVFLVRKKTGCDIRRLYAMKVLRKARIEGSEKDKTHLRSERKVLEHVKHPFIVDLIYAFQTRRKLYLVMEYISGGDLYQYMEREKFFEDHVARFFMCEIVVALEYLHVQGIIYRDLKPENILLDTEGHIKLTDFGLCKESIDDGCMTKTFCGTIEYMAPEIIKKDEYGKAVDWWSLGILFYDMLNGRPPFSGNSRKKLMKQITEGTIYIPQHLARQSKSLLKQTLNRNPRKRLGGGKRGANEVKNHCFFSGIVWNDVLMRKLEPPLKVFGGNNEDTSNFSETFTKQPPNDSLDDSFISDSAKQPFEGFSYTCNSFLDECMRNDMSSSSPVVPLIDTKAPPSSPLPPRNSPEFAFGIDQKPSTISPTAISLDEKMDVNEKLFESFNVVNDVLEGISYSPEAVQDSSRIVHGSGVCDNLIHLSDDMDGSSEDMNHFTEDLKEYSKGIDKSVEDTDDSTKDYSDDDDIDYSDDDDIDYSDDDDIEDSDDDSIEDSDDEHIDCSDDEHINCSDENIKEHPENIDNSAEETHYHFDDIGDSSIGVGYSSEDICDPPIGLGCLLKCISSPSKNSGCSKMLSDPSIDINISDPSTAINISDPSIAIECSSDYVFNSYEDLNHSFEIIPNYARISDKSHLWESDESEFEIIVESSGFSSQRDRSKPLSADVRAIC